MLRRTPLLALAAAGCALLGVGAYAEAEAGRQGPALAPAIAPAWQGRLTVETDPVYELLQVALAVSDLAGPEEDEQHVDKGTDYHREVLAHFGRHRDHPLVTALEGALGGARADGDWRPFTDLRWQALGYRLDGDGRVVPNPDYAVPGADGGLPPLLGGVLFPLGEHVDLLSDFSRDTGFRAFLDAHAGTYAALAEAGHSDCGYEGMWRWLEAQFPERHDSYRILASPLTGGLHSTITVPVSGGTDTQIIMWVSAYVPAEPGEVPTVADEANECRVVFTEIDHNYVNPVTDDHTDRLLAAMPDHRLWNDGAQGYHDAYRTFNEYMTWAVFSLWAMDRYPQEQWEPVITRQEDVMVDKRGFPAFRDFNRELMTRYAGRAEGETVADLYPGMLSWVAEHHGRLVSGGS
jgi:hypothetical protein